MPTINSEYGFNKAMLKELAKSNAEGGMPNMEEAATEYAANKATRDAAAVEASEHLALDQKKFMSNLQFARDQLSDYLKNNNVATLIAAVNVPVQGAAMMKQSERLVQQNATLKDITNIYAQNAANAVSAAKKNTADWQARYTPQPQPQPNVELPVSLAQFINPRPNIPYR